MKDAIHTPSDGLLKGASTLRIFGVIALIASIVLIAIGFGATAILAAGILGLIASIAMLALVKVIKGIYPIAYNAELDIAAKEQAE